jgi:ATP-dependent DNA helicase DinG
MVGRLAFINEKSSWVIGMGHGLWLDSDGVFETVAAADWLETIRQHQPILCHARSIGRRVGADIGPGWDILTLFAFARPAQSCVPTPQGVAFTLGLECHGWDRPGIDGLMIQALALQQAAQHLINEIHDISGTARIQAAAIARAMHRAGWPWGPAVLAALDAPETEEPTSDRRHLAVWERLPEWEENPPPSPPRHIPVDPAEARQRLGQLLALRPAHDPREDRPQQADYASALCQAFQPRTSPDQPQIVLAEAGTGIGKTLGYLAPSLVWAERNNAPVWISTYTRHLQNQIDAELSVAFANPAEKARHVVIRKGRENYICLLNLEEATNLLPTAPHFGIAVGLMLRWVETTRHGDLQGGDLPGWLADLIGRGRSQGLADRRGECIYAACPHYKRCFIERNVHQARTAKIVIANHALVMVQSALRGAAGREPANIGAEADDKSDQAAMLRIIFDEGHHLFDAADSAFACHLSGHEGYELRRWLLGIEGGRRSRMRGLRRRLEDRLVKDPTLEKFVDAAVEAAKILPGDSWFARIVSNEPQGEIEEFLVTVRQQILARSGGEDLPYGQECDPLPADDGVLTAAAKAQAGLVRLGQPLKKIAGLLRQILIDEADDLDSDQRRRLDALAASIEGRVAQLIGPWQLMLADLQEDAKQDPSGRNHAIAEQQKTASYVRWFALGRGDQAEPDIGFHRHWIDPTRPLAAILGPQLHGMVVTSATLTDGVGGNGVREEFLDWQRAEHRTGVSHWVTPPRRARMISPFDYPNQTKVIIIQDVRKDDLDQVAAAFRTLFIAAGGGGLGLFTAIQRLRAVHQRIAGDMAEAGIPLYAQHLDGLDVATLVDIFRFEESACLLGTDAVRDGVDVPGQALRLLVFDRVPWPRPDIIHRARRAAFDGRNYDDLLTRLRLKQAFGRLIRRAGDRGIFVMLDSMMPSRLYSAFPPGVVPQKLGLAEAIAAVETFFAATPLTPACS